MNFVKANETLGKRDRKKVGNNTWMERLGNGSIAVILHSTAVVVIHPDGTFTLDSGGWQTVTTKSRINEFSPAGLFQKKGTWYVADGSFDRLVEFYDGMKVRLGGVVSEASVA